MPAADAVTDADLQQEASASPPPARRSSFFKNSGSKVAPDAVTDNDLQGSVFDTGAAKVARGKEAAVSAAGGGGIAPTIASTAKGAVPVLAGMAPVVVGALMGPEGTLGKMAVQGAASVAQTLIQHETAKFLGSPEDAPGFNDFATNAAMNVGMSLLHIPLPGSAKAVSPEMDRIMAKNQVTASEAKAALLKRDVLKQAGMTDAQINEYYDRINKDPSSLDTDVRNVQTAQRAKSLYYDVKQSINDRFSAEFDALPHQDAPAPADILATSATDLAKNSRDPSSRVTPYLNKMAAFIQGGGQDTSALTFGGQPLRPEQVEQFRKMVGEKDAPKFTLSTVRRLITDARENLPANATPTEKAEMEQWRRQLQNTYETGMKGAGATNDDIVTARETYRRYGQAAETLRALDPKAPDFGKKVSDIVFGGAKDDPEVGLKFVNMVQEVDKLKPGTMAQFRQGILNQFLDESKVGAGGSPMKELQNLAAIQRKVAEFGPNDEGRAFLHAVFDDTSGYKTQTIKTKTGTTTVTIGKPVPSPLSDPKIFAKVVNGITDPTTHAASVSVLQRVGSAAMGTGMLGYFTRVLAITGIAYGVTGKEKSPFRSLMEWPTNAIIIGSALVSQPLASKFFGAGGPIQRGYVNYLLKPTPEALQTLVKLTAPTIGAAAAGIRQQSSLQQSNEPPPQPITP